MVQTLKSVPEVNIVTAHGFSNRVQLRDAGDGDFNKRRDVKISFLCTGYRDGARETEDDWGEACKVCYAENG
jgi:hypothetical protein